MSDYEDTFNTRGDHYNQASVLCPGARETERQQLIDRLALDPASRVLDAPAGGGYLADGIRPLLERPDQIVCVEPSSVFAGGIADAYEVHIAQLDALPLPDASVDRVGSLAGLHHLSDKQLFFNDASRVLKGGGRIAVADVMVGTPVAGFLNGSVNEFTETGHKGMFLADGELATLLSDAGFENVEEKHIEFFWSFADLDQMVMYCKSLFGMHKADLQQMSREIHRCFDIDDDGSGTRLPWSLIYAHADKPR